MAQFKARNSERQIEGVVRRSKQSGGSYDSYVVPDLQMFKAKEGECTVRILPPTWALKFRVPFRKNLAEKMPREKAFAEAAKLFPEEAKLFKKWGDGWEVQIYIHYNVGPDDGVYLCSDKMGRGPCPVCEARRGSDDAEESGAMKPSWRALCWVIDRNNEKAGPQVWSMPVTLFRDINARSTDKKTNAIILIDDREEGYDVMFVRSGTDKRTNYTAIEVSRDPSPIHDDEKKQEQWWSYIKENPLHEALNFYDSEYVEKVLFGKSERRKTKDNDDEDEETDTRRRPSRAAVEDEEEEEEKSSRPARGRRAAEEPEEDEDDPPFDKKGSRRRVVAAEEDDEDDGEEEKSSTTRRRSAVDEDEDAAEAEEQPRARGRRVAEEPEEEEESPRARKGSGVARRRPAAEPEEEAVEEDAAEDDEDEAPAKPSKARGGASKEGPSAQAKRQLERLRSRR